MRSAFKVFRWLCTFLSYKDKDKQSLDKAVSFTMICLWHLLWVKTWLIKFKMLSFQICLIKLIFREENGRWIDLIKFIAAFTFAYSYLA